VSRSLMSASRCRYQQRILKHLMEASTAEGGSIGRTVRENPSQNENRFCRVHRDPRRFVLVQGVFESLDGFGALRGLHAPAQVAEITV